MNSKCKEWTGADNGEGYGLRKINGKMKLVHRLAWEEANGPIPEGICVLHHCDNPPCHTISHLFLGTKADNSQDMIAKGRQGWIPAEHGTFSRYRNSGCRCEPCRDANRERSIQYYRSNRERILEQKRQAYAEIRPLQEAP